MQNAECRMQNESVGSADNQNYGRIVMRPYGKVFR